MTYSGAVAEWFRHLLVKQDYAGSIPVRTATVKRNEPH